MAQSKRGTGIQNWFTAGLWKLDQGQSYEKCRHLTEPGPTLCGVFVIASLPKISKQHFSGRPRLALLHFLHVYQAFGEFCDWRQFDKFSIETEGFFLNSLVLWGFLPQNTLTLHSSAPQHYCNCHLQRQFICYMYIGLSRTTMNPPLKGFSLGPVPCFPDPG